MLPEHCGYPQVIRKKKSGEMRAGFLVLLTFLLLTEFCNAQKNNIQSKKLEYWSDGGKVQTDSMFYTSGYFSHNLQLSGGEPQHSLGFKLSVKKSDKQFALTLFVKTAENPESSHTKAESVVFYFGKAELIKAVCVSKTGYAKDVITAELVLDSLLLAKLRSMPLERISIVTDKMIEGNQEQVMTRAGDNCEYNISNALNALTEYSNCYQ
jgi:hypothetical protein